ncbi:MAG: DUF2071 domain-containing protein [Polyangiaceae bacterium]|nr:DUF2071 domain-containing protein [Polyangiaceae bacterium]
MPQPGGKSASYSSRERALEWALLANFLIHGLALISMAALLLPTLPGGSEPDSAVRVATIAAHPWRFRLGWLPWQLCAAIDLWMAIAMLRTRWLPKLGTAWVLLFTLLAVLPDQYAQTVWVTRGVELAQTDRVAYFALERELFPLTAGWGAVCYTIAALGWTYCFARAGTWSRLLSVLSVPLWLAMGIAASSPVLPQSVRPSPQFISAANAVGFALLQVWLGLVTERVLLRARPDEPHGRLARWRYPGRGPVAWVANWLANSRFFGALLEPLPEAEMRSEITNVVYVNYLMRASDAKRLVPHGLELQRLGSGGEYALFTFLTYQHGHFGFAFMGPLRKLMPNPVQTNWRVHVYDPRTDYRGIYFLTNAIDAALPALAARLLTEGMPMHVLKQAEVRQADTALQVELDPGTGSAPDARLSLSPAEEPTWEGPWADCWPTFRAFLEYCVPQDRAMSSQPLKKRISRQEIDLGIPIDACEPMTGSVHSEAARRYLGDSADLTAPICFRVANVSFSFAIEAHDSYPLTLRGAELGSGDPASGRNQ